MHVGGSFAAKAMQDTVSTRKKLCAAGEAHKERASMSDINHITTVLSSDLEEFSISRTQSEALMELLQQTQGSKDQQALLRKIAFRIATNGIEEIGEIPTLDWLQQVVRGIYE